MPRVGDVIKVFGVGAPVAQVTWEQEYHLAEVRMEALLVTEAKYLALKERMEAEDWIVCELWRMLESESEEAEV